MTHMNAHKKEKDTDVIFVCVCVCIRKKSAVRKTLNAWKMIW